MEAGPQSNPGSGSASGHLGATGRNLQRAEAMGRALLQPQAEATPQERRTLHGLGGASGDRQRRARLFSGAELVSPTEVPDTRNSKLM